MAATESQPRASAEFVESSILEVVVPADAAINIKGELEAWDGSVEEEHSSVLPFVSERSLLLFDEIVPLFVVFRTPSVEEDTLNAYLARLAINLEAVVFGTAPPPGPEAKPPPPKEIIFSKTIEGAKEPLIIRHEQGTSRYIYAIWKLDVFAGRPRGRFHKPVIYFQPTASLRPAVNVKRKILDDEYLPSRVPRAMNLLQSFESDPALAGVHPRLSALRINKIAPTAPVTKELVRPIRTGQRRLFRTLSALVWRMRYSKTHAPVGDASLLASLDLEVTNVSGPGSSVTFDNIELEIEHGSVQPISRQSFPTSAHKPGDQITYIYTITPDLSLDRLPGQEGHIVLLKMKATVSLADAARPRLDIQWKTAVDFTADHNPSLVKAAHRLSNPALQQPVLPNRDALPQDVQSKGGDGAGPKPINVVLTFLGPPTVHVGETFEWEVFIVNRSDKVRKLALIVLSKRKRDMEKHKAHPSSSSLKSQRGEKKDQIACAVMDENIVYAKQKSARAEPAELVCLTTDVRIGNLAPGACYTAELKFLALSAGVLGVDAVRIVDLGTQEAADIRDLPSVVAVEKD